MSVAAMRMNGQGEWEELEMRLAGSCSELDSAFLALGLGFVALLAPLTCERVQGPAAVCASTLTKETLSRCFKLLLLLGKSTKAIKGYSGLWL